MFEIYSIIQPIIVPYVSGFALLFPFFHADHFITKGVSCHSNSIVRQKDAGIAGIGALPV